MVVRYERYFTDYERNKQRDRDFEYERKMTQFQLDSERYELERQYRSSREPDTATHRQDEPVDIVGARADFTLAHWDAYQEITGCPALPEGVRGQLIDVLGGPLKSIDCNIQTVRSLRENIQRQFEADGIVRALARLEEACTKYQDIRRSTGP